MDWLSEIVKEIIIAIIGLLVGGVSGGTIAYRIAVKKVSQAANNIGSVVTQVGGNNQK